MAVLRRGGPYASETQLLGGVPHVLPDVPISAIFLALFLIVGVSSFAIFIRNKKGGHKFVVNGALFGFGKIRIGTFSLRIAWACHPESVKLGLASNIFVYAGTIILFGITFIFALRIIRAQHPTFGWTKSVKGAFVLIFVVSILSLIAIIVAVLQSCFTRGTNIHRIDRDVELYGLTCFAVVAFLPFICVLLSTLLGQLPAVRRKRVTNPTDKFGEGRMRTKVWVALAASLILTLGAAFRAGINYLPPTPVFAADGRPPVSQSSPWYLSKASFYCFNSVTELAVVTMWLVTRVDRKFYVPDKSEGAYHPPPPPRKYGYPSGVSSTWSFQAFLKQKTDLTSQGVISEADDRDGEHNGSMSGRLESREGALTPEEKRERYRGTWQLEGPHRVLRYI